MTPTLEEITRLMLDAPGLGLQVPPGSLPAAWRKALDGRDYQSLHEAMLALALETPFLSISGLAKHCPEPVHPAEAAWDRIVARVFSGGRPEYWPDGVFKGHTQTCRDLLDDREYAALTVIGGYVSIRDTPREWVPKMRPAFLAAWERAGTSLVVVAH